MHIEMCPSCHAGGMANQAVFLTPAGRGRPVLPHCGTGAFNLPIRGGDGTATRTPRRGMQQFGSHAVNSGRPKKRAFAQELFYRSHRAKARPGFAQQQIMERGRLTPGSAHCLQVLTAVSINPCLSGDLFKALRLHPGRLPSVPTDGPP